MRLTTPSIARVLIVLGMIFVSAPQDAFFSGPSRSHSITLSPQRLVRSRVSFPRRALHSLRKSGDPRQIVAKYSDEMSAMGQLAYLSSTGFQRSIAKGNVDGSRWEPIDQRPAADEGDGEDEEENPAGGQADPSGRFVYALGLFQNLPGVQIPGEISTWRVDAESGYLERIADGTVTTVQNAFAGGIDPKGRTLYVASDWPTPGYVPFRSVRPMGPCRRWPCRRG